MKFCLPSSRVGDPVRFKSLSVFPLFSSTNGTIDYKLAHEALSEQSIVVQEVDEAGSVADLLVENKGSQPVLFLEGEELVGAKQNRVLNTSVLIAAGGKVIIPVSCVERGRWQYRSKFFGSSGSTPPSKLRRALKMSVTKSFKEHGSHRSDQHEVWKQVDELNALHQVDSHTAAMSDAFGSHEKQHAEFREQLQPVDGANGIAVSVGQRILAIDIFDKSTTCQRMWSRLLSGLFFDAMAAQGEKATSTTADVENLMKTVNESEWESSKAIGEGNELRTESPKGDIASALAVEDEVLHGSIAVAT